MGVLPLIKVIPRVRLMNVDEARGGVAIRDLSSWLNYEAENVPCSIFDRMLLARLHIP
jgi:hypothetical protein